MRAPILALLLLEAVLAFRLENLRPRMSESSLLDRQREPKSIPKVGVEANQDEVRTADDYLEQASIPSPVITLSDMKEVTTTLTAYNTAKSTSAATLVLVDVADQTVTATTYAAIVEPVIITDIVKQTFTETAFTMISDLIVISDTVEQTATSTTFTAAPEPTVSCRCGYKLAKHDNAYFPHKHETSFTSLKEGQLESLNSLEEYGWMVHDGDHVGEKGIDGTQCVSGARNVRTHDGALQLIVRGGQEKNTLSGAQITFNETVSGGLFDVVAKVSRVPGTAQRFWTYRHEPGSEDKQQFWAEGDALKNFDEHSSAHFQISGTDPVRVKEQKSVRVYGEGRTKAFPHDDPYHEYHSYKIYWNRDKVEFYFDDEKFDLGLHYVASHPSDFHIDNWSNANPEYMGGPPKEDVILSIKSINIWYRKDGTEMRPKYCEEKDVCVV